MGLVQKLFGHGEKSTGKKSRQDSARIDADRARALSTGPIQSQEEQASVREHMEAELTAQRERRTQTQTT